ncbi:hypothetical protein GGI15_004638 [Coemansia interrupta]|uniref:Enoyl reductase (ER) domain-containing protein n=1 Tax=Coemansia interrupta TaxID=1126814 RepID=A0A9W8H271_9FUNG|nr:hypothetical protein GGI15_004638 [Coemansia interrupta]
MVEGKINEISAWAAKSTGIAVEPWSYKPRPLGRDDVEIAIEHCGICGTDIHNMRGEWGGATYPIVVGHEIIGRIITKGEDVTGFNEGDRVGVGAQVFSCFESDCDACSTGQNPHCPHKVFTYNDRYADGEQAQGGYAEAIRVDHRYAFKIPDSIESEYAAPLLCAGATVFAPMLQKGIKKGDRVGVVGIGGLGHLAIQFAHGLGAEVTVYSHSADKRQQSVNLGASVFVNTSDEGEVAANRYKLDYLFVTANSDPERYNEFFSWMKYGGQIILLAVPQGQMKIAPAEIVFRNIGISGSLIGGRDEVQKTLDFAAEHNIRPIIECFPISKINEALEHVDAGKARYRVVLNAKD